MKELELKNKKGVSSWALVDDEDYDAVAKYKWHTNSWGYPVRGTTVGGKYKTLWLHRVILDAPKGTNVDHRDCNPLNNQKNNLRFCTPSQNVANRRRSKNNKSGYKGVVQCKVTKKWVAYIRSNGKSKNLGYFLTPKEAHEAYKREATTEFGEFARFE